MVAWFAGLFYLPRLFVYDVEAFSKPDQEKTAIQNQLRIMQRRLLNGIMWPAMSLTWIFGLSLAVYVDAFSQPWFHLKLLFVCLLTGYQLFCGKIRKELTGGYSRFNSKQMRFFNEIPTILLIVIVFTVFLKSGMLILSAVGIVSLLAIVLTIKKVA